MRSASTASSGAPEGKLVARQGRVLGALGRLPRQRGQLPLDLLPHPADGDAEDSLPAAHEVDDLILIAARLPQIYKNFAARSTGQLSVITFGANTLGCVARLFTTLQEGGGSAMMRSYALSEWLCVCGVRGRLGEGWEAGGNVAAGLCAWRADLCLPPAPGCHSQH